MTNTLKKHLIALIILLGIDLILAALLFFYCNSTERRMLPIFVLITDFNSMYIMGIRIIVSHKFCIIQRCKFRNA